MANKSIEVRIARLERVIVWLGMVMGFVLALGIGVAAGAYAQGDLLPWQWQAMLAMLAIIVVTAVILQRKMVRLDGPYAEGRLEGEQKRRVRQLIIGDRVSFRKRSGKSHDTGTIPSS
jgi:membrane protein implicated in regulation of membrane protease activity